MSPGWTPYNALIGSDANLDFGTATNRPSVSPAGTPEPTEFPTPVKSPYIKGVEFVIPTVCLGNDLKPFGPYLSVPSPPFDCVGDLGRNAFTRPGFFQTDLRIARKFPINGRWNVKVIGDSFKMLNRRNISDVNPLCDPTSGSCTAGTPTASYDPRTFPFALKINW